MTRRGHVAEEEASCAKFLYVNRDFRRRPCVAERGEDGRKGWDEDMVMEVQAALADNCKSYGAVPNMSVVFLKVSGLCIAV
jgi:hypothetical protein